MNIEKAKPTDLAAIRDLLTGGDLPVDDLSATLLTHFLVLRDGEEARGAIGLQPDGDVALLRSLVVAPSLRGSGAGTKLAEAAEVLAKELGIEKLCLLTTSADQFFSARGYRRIHRDDAPPQIKSSAQFTSLCPLTSIVMVKP
jgi:amino-acid N-acetyltransferase